jgi:hypothetical protein
MHLPSLGILRDHGDAGPRFRDPGGFPVSSPGPRRVRTRPARYGPGPHWRTGRAGRGHGRMALPGRLAGVAAVLGAPRTLTWKGAGHVPCHPQRRAVACPAARAWPTACRRRPRVGGQAARVSDCFLAGGCTGAPAACLCGQTIKNLGGFMILSFCQLWELTERQDHGAGPAGRPAPRRPR